MKDFGFNKTMADLMLAKLQSPSLRQTALDWPQYSPDLAPIENIWSILKFNERRIMEKN